MAHPVFPPPPAGAASSGPLVDLGQPIPDVAGLCRTERAQTRVARIGSPMDSPSMGVPWARGAYRGTFMPQLPGDGAPNGLAITGRFCLVRGPMRTLGGHCIRTTQDGDLG